MRTGTEAFRVALTPHNKATGAHASGHNTQIPFPRTDSAFTGYPNVSAEMVLHRHIVVMTVHGFGSYCKWWKMLFQSLQNQIKHGLPISKRIVLCPMHRLYIIGKMLSSFREIRKIPIR